MHLLLPWQVIPQPPQFAASVAVCTHTPLHKA
jgi:hypothetical protein